MHIDFKSIPFRGYTGCLTNFNGGHSFKRVENHCDKLLFPNRIVATRISDGNAFVAACCLTIDSLVHDRHYYENSFMSTSKNSSRDLETPP